MNEPTLSLLSTHIHKCDINKLYIQFIQSCTLKTGSSNIEKLVYNET